MLGYFHPKIVFFISKFKSYLFEFYLVCEGLAVRLALFLFQLNLTFARWHHAPYKMAPHALKGQKLLAQGGH